MAAKKDTKIINKTKQTNYLSLMIEKGPTLNPKAVVRDI